MRLRRASVKGLFGTFDHDVRFPSHDNLVIIHGPNGFGKTVMLRMIRSLIAGQAGIFEHTPFEEFRLEFDDGTVRFATSDAHEGSHRRRVTLTHEAPGTRTRVTRAPDALNKETLDFIDQFVPRLTRFKDGWRDIDGRSYSLHDVLARFPSIRDHLPGNLRDKLDSFALPDFSVYFVQTNRLSAPVSTSAQERFAWHRGEMVLDDAELEAESLRVVQYSTDLTQRIQSVLASYAKNSQESDRTFPERLVHFLRTEEQPLTEREILSQMADLEAQRQRLINLGFLDTETGLTDLTEADVNRAREALSIYVGDVTQKLRVFDDLALRVGRLTDIINERFQHKTLRVRRQDGFTIVADDGSTVELALLSSGEQHELVLLYELLFLVPKNGLVLIDEPEISLHVGWQSRFLADLIGILEITGSHAIVATHAPAIIGNRWDLTVELGSDPR